MQDRLSASDEKRRADFIKDVPVGSFVINLGVMGANTLTYRYGITAEGEIYEENSKSTIVNVRDVDGTGRTDKWTSSNVKRLTLRPESEQEVSSID